MAVSKSKNIGKWFENKTDGILKEGRNKKMCTFVRLYDSYAAQGNMLGNQPGDFIVMSRGNGILLECKSSEKHGSLRSCLSANVEDHQGASHRLWEINGGRAVFVFYTDITDEVEFWDGLYVGACKATGTPLDKSRRLGCVPLKKYKETLIHYLTTGVVIE